MPIDSSLYPQAIYVDSMSDRIPPEEALRDLRHPDLVRQRVEQDPERGDLYWPGQ
jgi:hypothetical protein